MFYADVGSNDQKLWGLSYFIEMEITSISRSAILPLLLSELQGDGVLPQEESLGKGGATTLDLDEFSEKFQTAFQKMQYKLLENEMTPPPLELFRKFIQIQCGSATLP